MCLLCMECGLPLLLWLHYGCCLNHHCCVSHMCVCVCVCVVGVCVVFRHTPLPAQIPTHVKLFNFYKLYATTMRTQMATDRQTFLSYKLLFIWYFCFFYYFNFLFCFSHFSVLFDFRFSYTYILALILLTDRSIVCVCFRCTF